MTKFSYAFLRGCRRK